MNSDIDIGILSAKYGFVKANEKISAYDRKMDTQRATELGPTMRQQLHQYISNMGYERVVINAGKEYRKAIDGFDNDLSVNTYHVCGDGLGLKGQSLKQFLRGNESGIKRAN
nr:DUF6884 domain-containing protein [Natronorubrum texcoconense]